MLRSSLLFLILATTVGASPARGEITEASPADSAKYRFTEVTTEAVRTLTSVGGAAAVEVDVDTMDVAPAPSVEEVLRELPLLHVRTNSRGEAEISARGSESRQVAVLVDGVPITLAWDARADVSVLPATGVQKLTFVRGLSSMLYGPNVLGGIVEAQVGRSLTQPDRSATQIAVGADHVGAVSTSVSTSVPVESESGDWLFRAGFGYRNSPGDPLADGVTEPLPEGDDLRVNTDLEKFDGFASARYLHWSGAWVSLSGSSFKLDRGIAAELGLADEDARLWRYPHVSRTVAVLSAGTGFRSSPFGGQGDIEASFGFDNGRTDIDEYTSRAYDEVAGFENGEDQTLTFRLLADQTLGDRSNLRGSFTFASVNHDEITEESVNDIPQTVTTPYQQQLMSVGVENDWKILQSNGPVNSVSLTVGAAYDQADTPKTGGRESLGTISKWGGRLGLSAATHQGRTVYHAGVSRRGRFPALRELYSGALNRFQPNPDLKPETLLTMEAGVTSRIGTGEVQAVLFHNLLEDAVVRTTLEDRRFFRVNRDELRSTGLELLGAHYVGPFDVSGSLTWQSVELTDTSVDTSDPSADNTSDPENLPELFGDLTVALPLPGQLRFGGSVEYTGTQFAIDGLTDELVELDDATIVGFFASKTWRPDLPWNGGTFRFLEARIGVDNVGDQARYDAWGLPEPGRRIRFGLKLY
ncbi:MAG: TonB-dependent receptor [Candidatus Eisenbacteria bacterium]|uniref:TonB-dependent receptor n=1 Tax=Eiseniibacteriota bacterium TaxID=2212470 RepID=A0A956NEX2_UNCEI|nr:TonB-dependent receptor [Candidatus Eisenbacteria bacterium]